jgi:thymidylate synthase
MKALKIKTITGTAVIIIDASMGEVKLNPLKKNNWLEATPSNPQRIKIGKSFLATFSFNNDDFSIQNNNPAPKILKKTNAEGPILLGMIPLATMWFMP